MVFLLLSNIFCLFFSVGIQSFIGKENCDVRRITETFLGALWRLSNVYIAFEPRFLYFKGRLSWGTGKDKKALKRFAQGLEIAGFFFFFFFFFFNFIFNNNPQENINYYWTLPYSTSPLGKGWPFLKKETLPLKVQKICCGFVGPWAIGKEITRPPLLQIPLPFLPRRKML